MAEDGKPELFGTYGPVMHYGFPIDEKIMLPKFYMPLIKSIIDFTAPVKHFNIERNACQF